MLKPIIVTPAESGQKLFQFLARRFNIPSSMLHRWIRTGQVRINGKRSHPFTILSVEDKVRIPPFAQHNSKRHLYSNQIPSQQIVLKDPPPLPPIIAETPELIVFCKPAGLPVHGGTGLTDSLTHRLALYYTEASFMPTPIHRLDKDSSGILLVAKTYSSLKCIAHLFATNKQITKEYLVWVIGECPWSDPIYLEDELIKVKIKNKRRMTTTQMQQEKLSCVINPPQKAALTAHCIKQYKKYSLLLIKLHTGRTHQIRVQLASRNFPVLGDSIYGKISHSDGLKLHAFRLTLYDTTYNVIPTWQGPWQVTKNDIPT